MGQTVHQIEDHIDNSREDLRSNLEELAQRAKSAVDWRERFRGSPGRYWQLHSAAALSWPT